MRIKLLSAVSAISILAAAASYADDSATNKAGSYYAGLRGGLSKSLNTKLSTSYTISGTTTNASPKIKSTNSSNFNLVAGYYAMDNVRAELSLGYIPSSLKVSTSGTLTNGATGDLTLKTKTMNALVHAYYDIGTFGSFTPYIGVGAGAAKNESKLSGSAASGSYNTTFSVKKNKTNFAYQLSVGTAVALHECLDLDLSYRFSDYGKAYKDVTNTLTLNSTSVNGTIFGSKTKVRAHQLLAGLRYSF